jgi:hypothetical protein
LKPNEYTGTDSEAKEGRIASLFGGMMGYIRGNATNDNSQDNSNKFA